MVDWTSQAELAREEDIFTKLIFCLFGVYIWEVFQTYDFEWSLLIRRRKFSWPLSMIFSVGSQNTANSILLVFFFLARYCMLFSLIGLMISLVITTPINCGGLYIFTSWTGNMAILASSTSLMIRTIALWDRDKRVVAVLGAACLGHWGVLFRGMFIVHATYSQEHQKCIVTSSDHIFLNITFFSTMAFDFLVLCFTLAILLQQEARTDLWKLLFQDGLVYFFLAFLCNAVPAILNCINLNAVMDVVATIPVTTVTTIAACRLVMRLQDFKYRGDIYVHSSQRIGSRGTHASRGYLHFAHHALRTPEIVVTTDQIVMDDFSPASLDSLKEEQMAIRGDLEAGTYLNTELEDMEKGSEVKAAAL